MSASTASARRIKFLARDLPFPTDPTFREYRVVQDLTSVTANEIMSGTAGVWLLPALAIVALMRADKDVTRDVLDRVLDLDPSKFEVTGLPESEDTDPNAGSEVKPRGKKPTGTESTPEIPEGSGTPE